VLVLHGGMESSSDYADLAGALSDQGFSVHRPDRRGRGLSGPRGSGSALAAEVADVHALLEATGARHVFGVSSGGVVALRAGLELEGVETVSTYEPALDLRADQRRAAASVRRYEDAVDRGATAEALIAMLKGTQVGPRWLRLLPRRVAVALMRRFIDSEATTDPEEVTFASLVPTMRYDFQISQEGSAEVARFADLRRPVLLLAGTKSPDYLTDALSTLARLLPDQRHVTLRGAGHTASSNRAEGGRPDLVARELTSFLTSKAR
jgi:pimeloyl-ACP methyl ester carboxylesterase